MAEKILPELRRSKMKVTIDIIGKSDAQLKDLALNNPSSLSVDEMLYASNLVSEGDKKVVLQKTSELYPNDYRAFNNLGVIAFKAGNITDAKKFFEKAYTMSKAPEVCSNMALVSLATGADNATVSSYLGAAAGSEGFKEVQGLLYLKQGDYAKAADAFGNMKTNNAALAQILVKDYNKAKATLDAVQQPNAETYYMKALVGARTNNKDLVISGLTAAIKADRSFAQKAANDLEFSKYWQDASVAALLK
jgi:tetratricopeptide (TPR) repeat protein